MKLWEVQTGKCLFTWEFPTAVKRVAFSEDDSLIACITEQRMGYRVLSGYSKSTDWAKELTVCARSLGFADETDAFILKF
jgi:hypothetical protein